MIEVKEQTLAMEDATEFVYAVSTILAHISFVRAAIRSDKTGWSNENTQEFLKYTSGKMSGVLAILDVSLSDLVMIQEEVDQKVAKQYGAKRPH